MIAPIRSRFRAAGAWRMALCALLGVAASQPAAAQPYLPDQAPGRQEAKQNAEPLPQPFRMRESQVDFGVVRPNASKKTEVELFNSSKHPIRLTRVTSTCTCTAGLIEGAEVVPPGGVGKIEIGVKANPNLGPINQRVTVWYLDPNTGREGRFVVPVVGEVALAVKTDPFFINLLREDKTGVIEVVATDGPVGLEAVCASIRDFKSAEVRLAAEQLLDEGILTDHGGELRVAVHHVSLVQDDADHRLESLRQFLGGVAALVYRRFFTNDSEAEAFARVLSFRASRAAIKHLRTESYAALRAHILDLDAAAEDADDGVQATVFVGFAEEPNDPFWRPRS